MNKEKIIFTCKICGYEKENVNPIEMYSEFIVFTTNCDPHIILCHLCWIIQEWKAVENIFPAELKMLTLLEKKIKRRNGETEKEGETCKKSTTHSIK